MGVVEALAVLCGVSLAFGSEGKTRRAPSTASGLDRFREDTT